MKLLTLIHEFNLCIRSHCYPNVDAAMESMCIARIAGVRGSIVVGCAVCGRFHVDYGTKVRVGNRVFDR